MPQNNHKELVPTVNSSLSEKTLAYWRFSTMYNGRPGSGIQGAMTTESAFGLMNNILKVLGPHRRLVTHVYALQDEIVMGRSNRQPQPATITHLPQRQVTAQVQVTAQHG